MIYVACLHLDHCNSISRYHVIMVEKRKKKEDCQKIDDLPVLATQGWRSRSSRHDDRRTNVLTEIGSPLLAGEKPVYYLHRSMPIQTYMVRCYRKFDRLEYYYVAFIFPREFYCQALLFPRRYYHSRKISSTST